MADGTHHFAWQGFSLELPGDWNLAGHQGDARAGVVTFADLRRETLSVRWQRVKQPGRARDKLMRSLERKGAKVTAGGCSSHLIGHTSFNGCIVAGTTRLYELQAHTDAEVKGVGETFADHAAEECWPWRVYGIQGSVPRWLRLQRVDLHPGRPRLVFRRLRTVVTLGAWPLADELLARRTLAEWALATIPLLRNSPTALRHSTATEAIFMIPGKLFRRGQEIAFNHDVAANTIHWMQERVGNLRHSSR